MSSKANMNFLTEIKLNQNENISLSEYYNKLFLKINKLITIEDIFDLESIGVLEMLKKLFSLLNLESEEFFADFVIKKKLMPLHEKAQGMINVEKEFDINVCFPIDDDELNLSVSSGKGKNIKNESEKNENDSGKNVEENNKSSNDEKIEENNEEKITVDKNLYTPNKN